MTSNLITNALQDALLNRLTQEHFNARIDCENGAGYFTCQVQCDRTVTTPVYYLPENVQTEDLVGQEFQVNFEVYMYNNRNRLYCYNATVGAYVASATVDPEEGTIVEIAIGCDAEPTPEEVY